MKLKFYSSLRTEIIILFVFLEVILFNKPSNIQFIFSLIEYTFVTFIFLNNFKLGLSYFILFTVSSLSQMSYLFVNEYPLNFLGVRVIGISINIIYTIILAIGLIIIKIKNKKLTIKSNLPIKFLSYFILYSLCIGLVLTLLKINYGDNYLKDVLTYIPFFAYTILLSILDRETTIDIIKNGIIASFALMLFSLATNNLMQYGKGNFYLLQNTFGFISVIAIFFHKDYYNNILFILLIVFNLFILITGKYLIGGKQIIMLFITFLWIIFKYREIRIPALASLILFAIFIIPIFNFIVLFFSDNVISFKFQQISEIFTTTNFRTLAISRTSLGNIIGETYTLVTNFIKHPSFIFLGKGFGGALEDSHGYLAPWAGEAGYAAKDLIRNNFHKLHLPLLEVILKSGIVGFLAYSIIIVKGFFSKNSISFVFILLILSTFYVSKEFLLLTLLYLKLSHFNYVENNITK